MDLPYTFLWESSEFLAEWKAPLLKPEFLTGNDKDRLFVFSVYVISRCIKLLANGSGRNLAKLKAREYVLVVNSDY